MVFGDFLTRVRERAPLVHNITNYVTVNDVANMILACGASPIMSDEPADVEEITACLLYTSLIGDVHLLQRCTSPIAFAGVPICIFPCPLLTKEAI